MVFVVQKPTPQRTPTFDDLASAGHELLVVYLRRDNRKNGWGDIRLHHPHMFVDDTVANALRLAKKLWVRRHVQVVGVFGHRGPVRVAALLLSRASGRRVVTRSDSNIAAVLADSQAKRWARRLMLRVLLPSSARVWTIGEANERYWQDYLGLQNTVRIPYAVPALPNSMERVPERRLSDPRCLRFLFVGRLEPIKGPLLLVRAFRALSNDMEAQWSMDIVGDGPLRREVEDAAAGDSRITLHGACDYDRLDFHYRRSDVLVLPSTSEPWGLVVNEALGFGLWVVASDQVGAKELLTTRERGVVFESGSADDLIAKLREAPAHLVRSPRAEPTSTAELMIADIDHLIARRV